MSFTRSYGGEANGPDDKLKRHMQVVYARQTREKKVFMDELKEYRKHKDKQMLQSIVVAVGPRWYQALSVPQRNALDTLEFAIYQDLLEGRPMRTTAIMRTLGVYPRPSTTELMSCIHSGRRDPKEMLAQLYLSTYGYPIEGKRESYCLNARLMLSSILYLGLNTLIKLLEKTFTPEEPVKIPPKKPKKKPARAIPSPYLTTMVAKLYKPRKLRRPPPLPLPDLTVINEPYVEEPIIQKPPPPPPPPPPPKKRLPISYCEKLAGYAPITTNRVSATKVSVPVKKPPRANIRRPKSKTSFMDGLLKKPYGLGLESRKPGALRRKKPKLPPSTGTDNAQYTINGVYQIYGKTFFVLGNVSILPAQGELIHGGLKIVDGQCITIHLGFRGFAPEKKPDPCDCVKQWNDAVFDYVKNTKCTCGHYYDFGNEGNFPTDELPYFEKPTRTSPYTFHYDRIFEIDPKRIHMEKEFKKVWETDSVLNDGAEVEGPKTKDEKKRTGKKNVDDKDKSSKKKNRGASPEPGVQGDSDTDAKQRRKSKVLSVAQITSTNQQLDKSSKGKHTGSSNKASPSNATSLEDTRRGKKHLVHKKSYNKHDTGDGDRKKINLDKSLGEASSKTCLGMNPKPKDYLKCALRLMRRINVAARLPDLHLVPELREWMRRRLFGSFTVEEKKEYLRKSTTYWQMFTTLGEKGFGHVPPPKDPLYAGHTTWVHKQTLSNTFRKFTHRYKLSLFRSHAYVTNLLWRTMYQAEFPDKKFREIYFSYLWGRFEDIQLIHPYSSKESDERKLIMAKKRVVCLPDGYEPRG